MLLICVAQFQKRRQLRQKKKHKENQLKRRAEKGWIVSNTYHLQLIYPSQVVAVGRHHQTQDNTHNKFHQKNFTICYPWPHLHPCRHKLLLLILPLTQLPWSLYQGNNPMIHHRPLPLLNKHLYHPLLKYVHRL